MTTPRTKDRTQQLFEMLPKAIKVGRKAKQHLYISIRQDGSVLVYYHPSSTYYLHAEGRTLVEAFEIMVTKLATFNNLIRF